MENIRSSSYTSRGSYITAKEERPRKEGNEGEGKEGGAEADLGEETIDGGIK